MELCKFVDAYGAPVYVNPTRVCSVREDRSAGNTIIKFADNYLVHVTEDLEYVVNELNNATGPKGEKRLPDMIGNAESYKREIPIS